MLKDESRRGIAFILLIVLVVTMIPMFSLAQDEPEPVYHEKSGGGAYTGEPNPVVVQDGQVLAVMVKQDTTFYIWTSDGKEEYAPGKTWKSFFKSNDASMKKRSQVEYVSGSDKICIHKSDDVNKLYLLITKNGNEYTIAIGGEDRTASHGSYAIFTPPDIPEKVTGTVELDKVNPSKEKLQGAQFSLYKGAVASDDNLVTSGATDINGHLEFKNLNIDENGTSYTLIETKAPDNYTTAGAVPRTFTLTKANPTKYYMGDESIVNTPVPPEEIKGIVELDKVNPSKEKLQGAQFSLYKGTVASDDNFVTSGATDINGHLGFKNLNIDENGTSYTLVETKAPDNYTTAGAVPLTFTLTKASPTKYYMGDESIVNTPVPPEEIKGIVELDKVNPSKEKLQGAQFSLYKGTVASDDNFVTSGATDINGHLKFENLDIDENGTSYTLVETKAPDNYTTAGSMPLTFTLTKANPTKYYTDDDAIVNIPITEESYGMLELNKVDFSDGSVISGASFELVDSGGNSYGVRTTNEDGIATWGGLSISESYYLHELSAAEGYLDGSFKINGVSVDSDGYEVIISDADNPVLNITATNEKGTVFGDEDYPNDPPYVLGETADPYHAGSVLGEEAKTSDMQNMMLLGLLVLAALTIIGIISVRRTTK